MTTQTKQQPLTVRQIAERLLANSDDARPLLSPAVIEALRQMVDETKHHDPLRAMKIADCAFAAAALLNEPIAIATAAWAKATAHIFLFELQSALQNLQHAEAIFLTNGCLFELVSVQAPMVYVLNALGNASAALKLADEVRPRCHDLGKRGLLSLINLEMNVGTVLIQRGEYEASLLACDRATRAATELEDRAALGRIDINRANVFQELDRHSDAERCYQQARKALVQSQHNRQQVALVDLNLGLLELRRGDYWQALRHLESAGEGFVSPAHIAWVDFNRALVYHRLNLNGETIILASRAVDSLRAAGSLREVAMALMVWASAAEKMGTLNEASELLQRAYDNFCECGAAVMAQQARIAQAEFALRHGESATVQSILSELHQSPSLQRLPTLITQIELIEIEHAIQRSATAFDRLQPRIDLIIANLETAGQGLLLLRAYHLRAQLLASAGDLAGAEVAYHLAMALVLDMRQTLLLDEFQIAFLEQHLPLFLAAAALQLQSANNTATVAHILALATTTPDQHHRSAMNQLHSNELSRLRNDWHWHQSKLERMLESDSLESEGELRAAQQQLHQIEAQIADAGRRLSARSHSAAKDDTTVRQVRKWNAIEYGAKLQQSLLEDEAYLHFFVIQRALHVLIATRHTLTTVALGATTGVDSALRAWRHHLRDWAMIATEPTLAAQIAARPLLLLFRTLFQPLLPMLNRCRHLYLMLPPHWSDLPAAALLHDGAPLIERWTVTQLVSPLSLFDRARLVIKPESAKSLLIGLAEQAGLTQTTGELQRIATMAPPNWSHQLLLNEVATQERVLNIMTSCNLLHIATHAIFRADNPLFSWLQLADGRLTVADLYQRVQLTQRPLTVLSACETARGEHSGLLGVARALLAVGAGELVATQWKVEDSASAQLMVEFYRHWFVPRQFGSAHTATALAAAQRTLASSLHPAYWAGFVNIW